MDRIEIRIAGAGGHGIVFAGRVLGYALVKEGYEVIMRVAYSPAQRGGWSKADIVVSKSEILSPIVEEPHVLIVTTQDRYNEEVGYVRKNGVVIYEAETVRPTREAPTHIGIEAFKIAEETTGSRQFGNSVLLGFFAAITGLVSVDTIENVMKELNVKALERNIAALRAGYRYGVEKNLRILLV